VSAEYPESSFLGLEVEGREGEGQLGAQVRRSGGQWRGYGRC
jgi:hypothetical protein